jgi:serine/threonine-protein kinase
LGDRYSIERELGEGGMATVYLATDVKHDRQVAIKVLKPELAAVIGAERFLAEIKTTANLQHPHVLPLHDSGDVKGLLYFVMPYVEGESLRDRIDREKQLPVDDAVGIASEVADALEYAHGRGVIHRDIKPANILLHEGRALVADFGIALAVSSAGGTRLTETGLSIGTPQYMSPEQATGDRELDGRSDLYSLGCVLYEMLAGEPPHTGSTAQAIFARVLTDEPRALSELRPTVPAAVEAAVHGALQKLPADRFASAGEFADALADPEHQIPLAALQSRVSEKPVGSVPLMLAAVGIAFGFWGVWQGGGGTPGSATGDSTHRLAVPLPEDRNLVANIGTPPPFDVSHDGRWLVYAGDAGDGPRLFLRDLSSFEPASELPDTEDAQAPFFSADGAWIGFFAEDELRRIGTGGGEVLPITTARGVPRGATWGSNGTILFALRGDSLFSVPESGGPATGILLSPVNEPIPGPGDTVATMVSGFAPSWPQYLPGERQALVTVEDGTGVLDLESGDFRYVASEGQATYLPTGHLLLHEAEGRLRLAPFDLNALDVTGPPQPILESVFRGPASGAAMVRVSGNGTVVYVSGGFDRTLWLVERDGSSMRIDTQPRGYRFPAVSPDGGTIALTIDPRPSDIWTFDFQGRGQPFFTGESHDILPVWHPTGQRMALSIGNEAAVMNVPPDGEPFLFHRPESQWPTSWLGDGRIVADERAADTGRDIIVMDPATGESDGFHVTAANEYSPAASPNGRWVAFTSDVSGTPEIYALPESGEGAPIPVSIGGGSDAKWARDGSEVFYRRGSTIMAVPIENAATLQVGTPVELFSGNWDFAQERNWDPTPDGRFVMVQADPRATRQLQVVVNWFAEIEGRDQAAQRPR